MERREPDIGLLSNTSVDSIANSQKTTKVRSHRAGQAKIEGHGLLRERATGNNPDLLLRFQRAEPRE